MGKREGGWKKKLEINKNEKYSVVVADSTTALHSEYLAGCIELKGGETRGQESQRKGERTMHIYIYRERERECINGKSQGQSKHAKEFNEGNEGMQPLLLLEAHISNVCVILVYMCACDTSIYVLTPHHLLHTPLQSPGTVCRTYRTYVRYITTYVAYVGRK